MLKLQSSCWELEDIDAVLFDKDGTIIDSHLYWGGIIEKRSRALISSFELVPTIHEDLCRAMGYSISQRRLLPQGPIALVSREEVISAVQQYLKSIGTKADAGMISELFQEVHTDFLNVIKEYIAILPGARKLVQQISEAGARTALVTTDSKPNAEQIVEHLGIRANFDIIIGKESTPLSKVTGVPAKLACEALGVSPDRTICIGDAEMDALMANNAGLKGCVAVALGQTPLHDLAKYTKYVLKDYTELKVVLQGREKWANK